MNQRINNEVRVEEIKRATTTISLVIFRSYSQLSEQ
jgi:hypothetical protein